MTGLTTGIIVWSIQSLRRHRLITLKIFRRLVKTIQWLVANDDTWQLDRSILQKTDQYCVIIYLYIYIYIYIYIRATYYSQTCRLNFCLFISRSADAADIRWICPSERLLAWDRRMEQPVPADAGQSEEGDGFTHVDMKHFGGHKDEVGAPRSFMMTLWLGNTFQITSPFWGKFTDHQWIPLSRAQ